MDFNNIYLCRTCNWRLNRKASAQVDWLSWLAFGQEFGLSQPLVLDLSVLKITFGFTININMASIIGMAIALFIYRWI